MPSPSFSAMPASIMPIMTSPPPTVVSSPLIHITLPGSQPGSQEEKIGALDNLDDQALSPEKGSETESDKMTPEKTTVGESQSALAGSESAVKKRTRRSKRVTSKKQKLVSYSPPDTLAGEASKGGDAGTTLSSSSAKTPSKRPEKLPLKSGSDSKGSGGKK